MDNRQRLVDLIGHEPMLRLETNFPTFTLRDYQVEAVERIVELVQGSANPLLILDPGLGKTLISQLIFLALRKRDCDNWGKALVLVPSRLLRDQHAAAASWMGGYVSILNLDEAANRDLIVLRTKFEKAHWIVSTPTRLLNALNKDYFLRRALRDVRLCVVDEFDAQAAEDIDELGKPLGRLGKPAKELVEELHANNVSFLCMSATTGTASEPWLQEFDLREVKVPRHLLSGYEAFVNVVPVQVYDEKAITADLQISLVIKDTLRKIREKVTGEFLVYHELNADEVVRQADQILQGRRQYISFTAPLFIRHKVQRGDDIWKFLGRLLEANNYRLALYEGRLKAIEIQTYDRSALNNRSGKTQRVESVRDVDYTAGVQHTKKLSAVAKIIEERSGQRALILTRNTDVNELITQVLSSRGWSCSSVVGEMKTEQRRHAIDRFVAGDAQVAVVNRQIGGRGFDLPYADYAIFLSPKRKEEVMWQEMLRIRSTKLRTKDAYISFYEQTGEKDKHSSLMSVMIERSERYGLSPARLVQ